MAPFTDQNMRKIRMTLSRAMRTMFELLASTRLQVFTKEQVQVPYKRHDKKTTK